MVCLCTFVRVGGSVLMAWKYVFLGIGLTVAAAAYWLYTPLPDELHGAYSSASVRHIQMMLATGKVIKAVVGVLLLFFFSYVPVRLW